MMRPDDLSTTVYLHKDPVDFRKSINGLAILVEAEMDLNPFEKALFAFCNHRKRCQIYFLKPENSSETF